jgi:hypothetical protein
MKFLDFYLSSGTRTVSLFIGTVVGLITSFFTDWKIGTLVGGCAVILASVIIPIIMYHEEKPYNKAKTAINQPFLIDERVRFTVQGGTVGGFFILTESSMVFLSLERGDHRLELSHSDVVSVICDQDMMINIFLNNKQCIRVISGVCAEICDVLRQNGWSVTSEQ